MLFLSKNIMLGFKPTFTLNNAVDNLCKMSLIITEKNKKHLFSKKISDAVF